MIKWQDSWRNADTKIIRNDELKVPTPVTPRTIALVVVEMINLKDRLRHQTDRYVEYIDDGVQYREAMAHNIEISDCLELLNKKLDKYTSMCYTKL